eukprot:1016268-Amphidinium_carterae.3
MPTTCAHSIEPHWARMLLLKHHQWTFCICRFTHCSHIRLAVQTTARHTPAILSFYSIVGLGVQQCAVQKTTMAHCMKEPVIKLGEVMACVAGFLSAVFVDV